MQEEKIPSHFYGLEKSQGIFRFLRALFRLPSFTGAKKDETHSLRSRK